MQSHLRNRRGPSPSVTNPIFPSQGVLVKQQAAAPNDFFTEVEDLSLALSCLDSFHHGTDLPDRKMLIIVA